MNVNFPCPHCRAERLGLEVRCIRCGWAPEAASREELAQVAYPPIKPRQGMLAGLDWYTEQAFPPWSTHRRVYLAIALCSWASCIVWHLCFPHTFWFTKAWAGLTTGGTVGTAIGFWWQLSRPERRATSSGWFLVIGVFGWGFVSVLALALLAPELASQEAELAKVRWLEYADIDEVRLSQGKYRSIHWGGLARQSIFGPPTDKQREIMQQNSQAMTQLRSLVQKATLYYPSHEQGLDVFHISIRLRSGAVLSYEANRPQGHPNDFAIRFHGSRSPCEILFPGGARWLETLRK